MTVFFLITFTAFLFENDNLFIFAVFQNGCFNLQTADYRRTYLSFARIVGIKQDTIKVDFFPTFHLQQRHFYFLIFFYAKLFARNLNNRIHFGFS